MKDIDFKDFLIQLDKRIEKKLWEHKLNGQYIILPSGQTIDVAYEFSKGKERVDNLKELLKSHATKEWVLKQLQDPTLFNKINQDIKNLREENKKMNINFLKEVTRSRIKEESTNTNSSKPVKDFTDMKYDALFDSKEFDFALSKDCYWDFQTKTVRSIRAVNKRPSFGEAKKDMPVQYSNIMFYRTTYDSNYQLYFFDQMKKLYRTNVGYSGLESVEELVIQNPEVITKENLYGFKAAYSPDYHSLLIFPGYIDNQSFTAYILDINTLTITDISLNGGSKPAKHVFVDALVWYDKTNRVFCFSGSSYNNDKLYTYSPDTNTFNSYNNSFSYMQNHIKAFDEATQTVYVFNPITRTVANIKFIGSGFDIKTNGLMGDVPNLAGAMAFIKDDEMLFFYCYEANDKVFALNLHNYQIYDKNYYVPKPLSSDDTSSVLYVEILQDNWGNPLYNQVRTAYFYNLNAEPTLYTWTYKYNEDPANPYNPSDPNNQVPWEFVTMPILTSEVLNFVYSYVTVLNNLYGQLVGVQYSRDDGKTWSEFVQTEDLTEISNQPSGTKLRLKIVAKHDAEIVSYGFGGMR
ncbi:hypothetical protein QYF48_16150 [Brevibacillus agri]|uniref:hypothetical protein n=1 Tax=Brevibacillus agri TaxID=51101 RepID=UPI0025B6AE7C|nr:hypothetical protein [Brevibacillus agri]MDN4094341.1 hypothetical protein [Brevibacillus agri]